MRFITAQNLEHKSIVEIDVCAEDRFAAQALDYTDFGYGLSNNFVVRTHFE
jgi:allophanate hydrolase subunit 1